MTAALATNVAFVIEVVKPHPHVALKVAQTFETGAALNKVDGAALG